MKDNAAYLTGKCLVAMPNMKDERFENSLIFICSHTENGAMGFVVNKRMPEFSFADRRSDGKSPRFCVTFYRLC